MSTSDAGEHAVDGALSAADPTGESSIAASVSAKLQALQSMAYGMLQAEWRRLYRVEPPKRLGRELLMLGVGWKLQEQPLGGLRGRTKRMLTELSQTLAREGDVTRTRVTRLKPGANPIRECHVKRHTVLGLEQDFNSVGARREACEGCVKSQRHGGWQCLPAMYDDGGISGATMERPALKRLLADIEAGAIDAVVVYKVDRLTRSLADFAKIVEVFDAKGVSFVSVTQQFNTTTSMGRLTLNMLLSFPQFGREVTGDRIRDKIAAPKQRD